MPPFRLISSVTEWSDPNIWRLCGLCKEYFSSLFQLTNISQGISYYDGHAIANWKIIYLLLGGLAILVGVCVLIWMPDSPVNAGRLTLEGGTRSLIRVQTG